MGIAEKFIKQGQLDQEEYPELLKLYKDQKTIDLLKQEAVRIQKKYFGNKIYTRGLVEFTNYCRNDCYYCGIRRSNTNAVRYRLTKEEILQCCENGHELGFRTFVLQGGEDPWFNDERMVDIIQTIKRIIRIVRLPCLLVRNRKRATGNSGKQEQTVIFYDMRQLMKIITVIFIRRI